MAVPESVVLSPSGLTAYVPDSGNGVIWVLAIDPTTGALSVVTTVGGALGPVALAVGSTGQYAALASGKWGGLIVYSIDAATGSMTPGLFVAGALSAPTSIVIHGWFAYVTDAGSHTVSVFGLDPLTGQAALLSTVATGRQPQALAFEPSGRFAYVANFGDGSGAPGISVYRVDATTGLLTRVDVDPGLAGTQDVPAASPSWLTVGPSGRFAYVTNLESNTVSTYAIDPLTGLLAQAGGPIATGMSPVSVTVAGAVQ
jgi:6-phosphogluconolactonase